MIKAFLPKLFVVAALAAGMVATATFAEGFGRDALRSVVGACVIAKSTLGVAFPCADVQPDSPGADGYAIIRSPGFASEYLLAPLAALDGIESPELRKASATGFWQAAWAARDDVGSALGRPIPGDGIALAVNAAGTRTQDHFHIHVDCVRQSVRDTLASVGGQVSGNWAKLPRRLLGETYWARSIASPDLKGVNIPALIAEAPPAAGQPMGHVTLAVVGAKLADGEPGFYLVANWANSSAERLLDHSCKVAPLTS